MALDLHSEKRVGRAQGVRGHFGP